MKRIPKDGARRSMERLAAVGEHGRHGQKIQDQAVAAVLGRVSVETLNDVVGMTRFLYDAFRPGASLDVEVIRHVRADDEDARRWDALLEWIGAGIPPLPVETALKVGVAKDELVADPTPFVRPHWTADVGLHAERASSSVLTGRLLCLLVRAWRPTTALEVGTAYGLGSLYIAESLRRLGPGQLHTLEISNPQIEVARRRLSGEDNVHLHTGPASTLLDDTVSKVGPVQFVFHDGEHSKEAYERDFATIVEHLAPGSLVLLDDIRWDGPAVDDNGPQTYEGWRSVVAHRRVRAAAELSRRQGLILV